LSYPIESMREFLSRLHPVVSRSIHEFAEQEVRLPKGPKKGLNFDLNYAPFNRFIFDAIMDPYWRDVAVLGPTQNGKSLIATNIPLLYYLFELKEDVIFGLPSLDMASGMWSEKLRPVIEDSPYVELLPTTGAGSRGGDFTAIRFKNGVNLRFMGAGGSPEQMSSHTAKYIIMTEVDKMDESGGDGSEADPVSLIKMRSDAFEDSKCIMECTVSTERGRIWQEAMVHGSAGQIFVSCPFCHHWQKLYREGLVFDVSSQVSAENSAGYKCEECDKIWSNNDRLEALQDPRIAHKGQTVDELGQVVGPLPETRTFGLHFNVLHSPMQSLAKTAGQQWTADMSELKEIKKAMIQSKWAIPFEDEDVNRSKLSMNLLRKNSAESPYSMNIVPDWVDAIMFSTDIQEGYCYYLAEGYCLKSMRSTIIEYGTCEQREKTESGFYNMLTEVDGIAREGWAKEGGGTMSADYRMMDCGYRYDLIQVWLPKNRSWFGSKGVSRSERVRMTGKKEIYKIDGIMSVRQQDNGQVLWFIEVDNTKGLVHDRYLLESPNLDGFRYIPKDADITFFKHIMAEERVYDELGETFVWKKIKRRNDYLDCCSYNVALAYFAKKKGERKDEKQEKLAVANNIKAGFITPKNQRSDGRTFSSARGAGRTERNPWLSRGRSN
jgi:phage terminase large subunit GpA-like protein